MWTEMFLGVAVVLQLAAAVMAIRLIRVTGRLAAWSLISVALVLMVLRRVLPFIRGMSAQGASMNDPLNEVIGLVLSGFMLLGIALIGPIFDKIFTYERELKASEQRFRSYFELPIIGVAITSPDHRWMSVNERLCEMLGFPFPELAGTSLFELNHPEDTERERAMAETVDQGRANGYTLEKRFLKKDGEVFWVSQAARCVRNAEGGVSYYVVIVQDVTERKQAEKDLRNSLQEKEALLRELYHRTKNNMQVICSLLNLELAQCDDPKLSDEFQIIENRIYSMSLVHEKLYRSKDLAHIDLADYIEDLTRLLLQSYRISSEKIDLDIRLEPAVVPIDTAIPCGLILNELVTNALRHAFPGDRRGTIKIRLSKTEESLVEFLVADDGVGVNTEAVSPAPRGIGLRTIEALAEQIGGKVRFESEAGFACHVTFPDEDYLRGPERLASYV